MIHHAEVFSDGAVFYIGNVGEHGQQLEGVVEAHNYGGGSPDRDGVTGLDLAHLAFAPGLAVGDWVRADLAKWPEDCLFANYPNDATLEAIYVRTE